MSAKPTVGGQAVIEGVMIRSPHAWSVAVRRPDGVIETRSDPLPRLSARSRWARIPFVRGILVLGESLSLGFRSLAWSAQKAAGEGEEEITKRDFAFAMGIALLFFIGFFLLLPLGGAKLAERWFGESSIVFNVAEAVIRVGILVGYIALIGRMRDIRRVFEYHGAEHMSIHAYEAGDPLSVDAVQRYPTMHARCGTSFLLIVMLLAVVVFSLVGLAQPSWQWLILSRIVLIPVIAGIAYELLKASAEKRWLGVLAVPGIQLQRLTTKPPAADQVEVAIASLLAALSPENLEEVKGRGPVCPPALAALPA